MEQKEAVDLFDNGKISLEKAKAFIIKSLTDFDESIGARAKSILEDESHSFLEVEQPITEMMQSRPAGATESGLKKLDIWVVSNIFQNRFSPYFTEQENLTDKAIIDFEFDGTPRAVSLLAHELGHAIADALYREHGKTYEDFMSYQHEHQAYFVQIIVSQALIEQAPQECSWKNFDLVGVEKSSATCESFNNVTCEESSTSREGQMKVAGNLYQHASTLSGEARSEFVMGFMSGQPELNGSSPSLQSRNEI